MVMDGAATGRPEEGAGMGRMAAASTAVRARWAITAVFGGNGLLVASLAVRTPSLKLDLGLSAGRLGLASTLFGLSAVAAMQSTGGLAARLGSGSIVRVVIPLLPVLLVGVGVAPGFAQLAIVMVVFGAVYGTLDVTMNAHAVAVERVLDRHIMNGCHAAWSIGAVAGSLLGSGAAQAGMSRSVHYAVLAAVLVPTALLGGRALLPAHVDRSTETASEERIRAGWRTGWTRRVLLFGAMGASVLTVEAAVANWSGVFLHEHLSASLGVAALGYVAFTGCQTAGRLVGDRLLARGSAARLLRVGVLAAGGGLALVVLSPTAGLAVAGFAVLGLGLATPLPILFGVVGHLGAGPRGGQGAGAAASLARFSTMTYAGILLAPAIIGWFAELVGLTWTLAGLIPLLGGVAAVAGAATRPGDRAPEAVHSGVLADEPALAGSVRVSRWGG
jgi:MFS family permease